jgi:hypothetical protein
MNTNVDVPTNVDDGVISKMQDPLYKSFGNENIVENKKYDNFQPDSKPYGNVYMQKARGRILFIISEMNTTRKFANLFGNLLTSYTDEEKKSLSTNRGAAYREALMEVLTLDDATLGSYSVTSNLLKDNVVTRTASSTKEAVKKGISGISSSLGSFLTRKNGGKRNKKPLRKTQKKK